MQQQGRDVLVEFGGDIRYDVAEAEITVGGFPLHLGDVVAREEGQTVGDDPKQQDAEGIEVRAGVVGDALERLRGDVFHGAGHGVGGVAVDAPEEAEVAEDVGGFGGVGLQEDVAGFDVAVDEAAAMDVIEGRENLGREVAHLRELDAGAAEGAIPRGMVVHAVVDALPVLAVVEDPDDVGVIQIGEGFEFPPQELQRPEVRLQDRLYGDIAAAGAVVGFEHLGRAGAADGFADVVAVGQHGERPPASPFAGGGYSRRDGHRPSPSIYYPGAEYYDEVKGRGGRRRGPRPSRP